MFKNLWLSKCQRYEIGMLNIGKYEEHIIKALKILGLPFCSIDSQI